ncbi:MAG: 4-hydroxy-tetrahydrodipicolinate reductase [Planctomycetes bacterium]|nr:4-hydroxy-tetrahydrodipicolinate reductase [Planctomycetota bacterium]
MNRTRLAIHGAGGRMGRRLVALGAADARLEVVAALECPGYLHNGQDAGVLAGIGEIGVAIGPTLDVDVDCVIDFSVAEAVDGVLELCRGKRLPLVLATTGLSETKQSLVASVAKSVPVVWAPNMSLAVNLTMELATKAASVLKDCAGGADVEIIERHHRFKRDAPSGTALRFAELIAGVMGQTEHAHGREGLVGERPRHEIGFHAVRTGDNPGEHTILFGLLGESVELTVRVTNRDCYALGALEAARFAVRQRPGLYGMDDVLGLGNSAARDMTP